MVNQDNYDWVKPKEGALPEFYALEPAELEKEVIDRSEITPYKVEVKVINILGREICAYGHQIGDTFIIDGDNIQVINSNRTRSINFD